MLDDLDGRRALVTGATGGLGRTIARALHGAGAELVLSGRKRDALEELAAELGDRADIAPADLALAEDIERMAEVAAGVDVLVANAGLPASGSLDDFTPEQIDRALDVNLRAPIQMARAAAPEMVRRGAGHLVFMSSMSGKTTSAGQSLYSATKYGLGGFGFALNEDLRGTGVGATTVFPGFVSGAGMFVDTGLEAPAAIGTSTPEQVAEAVLRGIRTGKAEIDVASIGARAGARLYALSPSLAAGVMRRFGSAELAARFAERQREKR